jgi:hypothetical protein
MNNHQETSETVLLPIKGNLIFIPDNQDSEWTYGSPD